MTASQSELEAGLFAARLSLVRRTSRVLAFVWTPVIVAATLGYMSRHDPRTPAALLLCVLIGAATIMTWRVTAATLNTVAIGFLVMVQLGIVLAMSVNGMQVANIVAAVVCVIWTTAMYGRRGLAAAVTLLAVQLIGTAWWNDWRVVTPLPATDEPAMWVRTISFIISGATLAGLVVISALEAFRTALDSERDAWHAQADERLARIVAEQSAEVLQRRQMTSALAAGFAHDLGNALQAAAMNAELLRESELAPEDQESVEQIVSAASRARAMVRDLLSFGRSVGNQAGDFSAREALDRLRFMLRGTVPGQIQATYGCETSARLRGDELRFGQIIVNLVMNAVHAMPSGGSLAVTIVEDGPEMIRLRVLDTGTGIPVALQARIFEPFFTTKGSREGSGLGLSMVKRIVEDVGGRIALESTEGKGTSVDVWWPIAEDSPTMA